jgi:hypothetical protein
MAQKPITQIPPGQIIKQQEAMKKVAEKRAAIDKVLNAELVKVDLVIKNENGSSQSMYQTRLFSLGDAINQSSILQRSLDADEPVVISKPEFKRTYTFLQKTKANVWGAIAKTTYGELLTNGINVTINFFTRKHKPGERGGGEYSADFDIILYFSDGTRLDYPLQGFKVGSGEGTWKSMKDLKIVKRIEGSEIPDPANPLVLPPVK